MKMKVTEIPVYPEIEVIAKTVNTVGGTIDRKPVKRVLITTEAVAKDYVVVGGDDTRIKGVSEIEEMELRVELVGGIKSLASYKFFKGYTAKNAENPEINELFTEEGEKIERLTETAKRMCESHPECDGQWKIIDNDGNRVIIREICKCLKANGKID